MGPNQVTECEQWNEDIWSGWCDGILNLLPPPAALGRQAWPWQSLPRCWYAQDAWDAEGCWQAGGALLDSWEASKMRCWYDLHNLLTLPCMFQTVISLNKNRVLLFPSPKPHHFQAPSEGLCCVWDRCEQPGVFELGKSCWVTLWSSVSSQLPLKKS